MNQALWLNQAHKNAGWLVALGVIEIILGVVVLFAPFAGGLAVTVLIGLSMALAGIARLFGAFAADSFGSGALAFAWGLLVAASGFYIFTNPGVGLMTLTLVLSVMFFVVGLTECVVAFQVKPERGWGWMLASGALALLLSILIWRQFPFSGIWLVGTLVGVNLLFNGLKTMMMGSAARRLTQGPPAPTLDESKLHAGT